ncbi:MAG: ABC transporter permease [Actinobacteria bacterium]|nr:ABC transporter permease [Actinomycetota bacterium]MCG2808160.1 ABC transporter permease [Coriobacteriia bacterium]
MKGAIRFLGKEFTEIVRTWRIWVVPGLLLFFAITSPILAIMTPALIESLAQGPSGIQIIVPDPTYLDAYAQWVGNLQEIVMFALIFTAGGMIAGERSQGTAILVLTKPVSRASFVVAKFVSNLVLLAAFTVTGALACWGVTYLVFHEAPVSRLAASTAAWLAYAVLILAFMTLYSARFKSLAAGGAGLGTFFMISVLTLWGPAVKYSPAGLLKASGDLLTGTQVDLAWPLLTTALGVVLLLGAAILVFRRQEI